MLSKSERLILQEALRLIENYHEALICRAIQSAHVYGKDSDKAKLRLKKYIMEKLSPDVTLGGWNMTQGRLMSGESKRAARIQWIKWMLGEL
jgi:hypothetical protein